MSAEAVLTVPASSVESFYKRSFWPGAEAIESVLRIVRGCGTFVDRDWAEEHHSVTQIVSFAVVHRGCRILVLRRARKDRRPALRLRYSLLFGGHVSTPEDDSLEPVSRALVRELREELGIELGCSPSPLGVLADSSSLSGRLHLGVVFAVAHPSASVRVPSSEAEGSEFVGGVRRVRFVDWRSLSRRADRFDRWSEILLYDGVVDGVIDAPLRRTLPPLQLQLALP
jgi:predicted NUDIX family phosphoesterase